MLGQIITELGVRLQIYAAALLVVLGGIVLSSLLLGVPSLIRQVRSWIEERDRGC